MGLLVLFFLACFGAAAFGLGIIRAMIAAVLATGLH